MLARLLSDFSPAQTAVCAENHPVGSSFIGMKEKKKPTIYP